MINENVSADGTYAFQVRVVPYAAASRVPPEPANLGPSKDENKEDSWIGLPVFEATEYGLARAFDYLGAQAQVLLDDVGRGAVEFLQSELHVQLSEDHRTSLQELLTFYAQSGLADRIDLDVSESKVEVSFTNYRYVPVLEQLLSDGYQLTSVHPSSQSNPSERRLCSDRHALEGLERSERRDEDGSPVRRPRL